jgi:hypothetical protein
MLANEVIKVLNLCMEHNYRDHLTGEAKGIPEIELDLAANHPTGVIETYHMGVNTFVDTMDSIMETIPNPEHKEAVKLVIHKMIAGVATYGYLAGQVDAKEGES